LSITVDHYEFQSAPDGLLLLTVGWLDVTMKDRIPCFHWQRKIALVVHKDAGMAVKQGCGKLEEDSPYVGLGQELTIPTVLSAIDLTGWMHALVPRLLIYDIL
jgi:hypothetical protein